MKQAIVRVNVLLAFLLSGCTSLVGDTRSVPEVIAASEARGDPEAGFQRYGPFTFLGKYRIQHEWIQAHPNLGGQGGCGYIWEGFTTDNRGRRTPTKAGLDMWEENGVLYQPADPARKRFESKSDMTRYVIGKYRPHAPGGPIYDHERLCRVYFEPLANEYELWLKKTSLDAMRAADEDNVAKHWKYARLTKPIRYEPTRFANLPAQRVVWTYSFAPKGREDNPTPLVTEEIRIPIGDTGYVYQLAFTLSDTIGQKEPEKAARRRAYWQRIQDSFRIEPLQR